MHAKPDLRVFLEWMIAGSGSVITDVIPSHIFWSASKMGLDVREISDDRRMQIADALMCAGFHVRINEKHAKATQNLSGSTRQSTSAKYVVYHEFVIQRDGCEIVLSYNNTGERGRFRIYIPNLNSWNWKRNRKLMKFQNEVTATLESVGAYFPDTGTA